MAQDDGNEITRLLRRVAEGDGSQLGRLFLLVRDELRVSAGHRLRNQGADCLLQPTMLVHDAFLRLIAQQGAEWCNRKQFFACAADAMRRMLVDWARRETAGKRDRSRKEPLLEELAESEQSADAILDLHEAVVRLGEQHERLGKVVEMRFFGGLDHNEVAEALGVSVRTVEKDWQFARTWLHRELSR